MNGVIISAEELESCASQVLSLKNSMEQTFDQTRSLIRGMSAYWQSPASNDAARQFETLSPVFPKYIELVNSYCTFLKQTAVDYRIEEEGYKKYPLYKGLLRIFPVFLCADEGDTRPFEQTQYKKR